MFFFINPTKEKTAFYNVRAHLPQNPSITGERNVKIKGALSFKSSYLHEYAKICFFYQLDGYLWPHFCMNNLYIRSHRSLYAPTYSFWAIGSMLISLFRVTSWLDTVCNIVTRWVNLRENMNWNYVTTIFRSILTQIYMYFWYYLHFFILTLKSS